MAILCGSFTWLRLALPMISFLIGGCAGEPDWTDAGGAPGLCKVSCDSAKIASHDMQIKWQHDIQGEGDFTVNCNGVVDKPVGAIPIRFLVERKGKSAVDGDENFFLPASGISFEAVILAGTMSDANPDPAAQEVQDKYRGINTNMDLWCTDECGVGSLDLSPICLANNQDVILLIRSGAVSKKIKISMKAK